MKKIAVVLAILAAAAVAGGASATQPASGITGTERAAKLHVEQVALTVRSDGHGGEVVSPSGGNIAIAPGVPVKVTVTNYTREFHTFTVPGLQVGALIFPADSHGPRKTTFTFTAWKSGVFAWYCVFCRHGGSHHRDHMGGKVYAIIDASAMP